MLAGSTGWISAEEIARDFSVPFRFVDDLARLECWPRLQTGHTLLFGVSSATVEEIVRPYAGGRGLSKFTLKRTKSSD